MSTVDPRRIPIIGNDIYQAGQVLDIIAQPCGPNPTIAVKAFWAYAPTLVWSLVKPEALDLAYDRVGRRHSRIGSRRARVTDLMQLPQPPKGGVRWAMFQAAEFGQRAGWYLLVLDATTDFLINWSSMAYQWSGCDVPDPHWGAYWGADPLGHAASPGDHRLVNGSSYEKLGSVGASNSTITVTRPGPVSVSASVTASTTEWNGMNGGIVDSYIKAERPGLGTTYHPASLRSRSGQKSTYDTVHMDWTGHDGYTFYTQHIVCGGGIYRIENATMTVNLGPPAGLMADP